MIWRLSIIWGNPWAGKKKKMCGPKYKVKRFALTVPSVKRTKRLEHPFSVGQITEPLSIFDTSINEPRESDNRD